jgi:3-hydroxy-9,10-secoandrosta-1,3,5(10)-triene-9,17-dione monooxygenase reductase component
MEVTVTDGRSSCHLLQRPDAGARPELGPADFRLVLGNFATGLTIVTAMTDVGPVGFTCQSFASLSLDPPLVLFCPSNTSTTWPRIRTAGRFCVNVLATDHQSLSARFSQSGSDKFAGVQFDLSPNGSPLLPGAVAWIDCMLQTEHQGGDHVIAVAAVENLAADPESSPLLFHRGRYAKVS